MALGEELTTFVIEPVVHAVRDPALDRAFEQGLPLRRPSDLVQRPIVQFLISASGGLLGEVSRLLTQAAEQAIQDHSERSLLQHLKHAAYEHA
jgi:hypothetical protein